MSFILNPYTFQTVAPEPYLVLDVTNITDVSCTLNFNLYNFSSPVTYTILRGSEILAQNYSGTSFNVTESTAGLTVNYTIVAYSGSLEKATTNKTVSYVKTWAQVFNDWRRFSHNTTTENQPASATEISSWTYSSSTNSLSCPINSLTYLGLVSNELYTSYIHKARLTSTASDDDLIGVIISFAVDGNGREHTLSAVRTRGGLQPRWGIYKNYRRSDQILLIDGNSKITSQTGGWNAVSTGTTVKITKTDNLIDARCSVFNSTSVLSSSSLLLDLSADPNLSIFRQPCAYGYSVFSQPNTTYSNIVFSYSE
jgi:hypothetical protein